MAEDNRRDGAGRRTPNQNRNSTQNRSNNRNTHPTQSRNPRTSQGPSQRSIQERKRRRRRKRRIQNIIKLAIMAAIVIVIIVVICSVVKHVRNKNNAENAVTVSSEEEVDTTQTSSSDSTSTDASEASGEKSDFVGELPDIDIDSWEYILANADNSIEEYAPPSVTEVDGIEVDSRIADAMTEFIEDTEAQGLPVYPSSGYRDYDEQTYLFERKISQGYSEEEAATIVAPPGTSEHQTGLAADITDVYRETKNESLEDTETYQWMSEHCQDYGFVVRYPKGKEDITGIIYEPWHFRYVGKEAAKFMMDNDLCLEEFIALYKNN